MFGPLLISKDKWGKYKESLEKTEALSHAPRDLKLGESMEIAGSG